MSSTFPNRRQQVTSVSAPDGMAPGEQREALLEHFGVRELPFGVTPNPSFLFSSRTHRAALESMIQSIEWNLGFTVLLGEPGTGKTTLLLQLLKQYRDSARTAFIFQTQGRRFDLLHLLASELELPDSNGDEVLLHQRLREMLADEALVGRKVLVIVDEAQNLNQTSLEAVRLLSNFETASSKLLHIILAGSARLGETLQGPDLLPLAQRVMTICRLERFTAEEVKDYVAFRLETAGCRAAKSVFTSEALAVIAEESGGVPRLINSICYRSLSTAFAERERQVTTRMVWQAARDLDLSDRGLGFNLTSADGPLRTENQNNDANFVSVSDMEEGPGAGGTGLDLDEGFPAVNGQEVGEHPDVCPAAHSSVANQHPAQSSLSPLRASSSSLRDNSVPTAARRYKHSLAKTMTVKGIFGQQSGVSGLFAFFRSARMKIDPATSLATVLIAIALVLWAAMFKLRSKVSDTAATPNLVVTDSVAHAPAVPVPGVPTLGSTDPKARNDNGNSLASGLRRETTQTLSAASNVEKAGRSMASLPAFETLPQTELPSRIDRQSSGPKEATTPLEPELISNLSPTSNLPLQSASARPIIPKFAAAAIAAPAEIPRRAIKVVQPQYPQMAKIRRIGGVVLLELEVDASGKVQKVRSVGGNSLLTEAAEAAARQWQYSPTPNQTVPSVILVQFNFSLDSEGKR
jgi:TonB family protein